MAKENSDFISREGTIIQIDAQRDISREKNGSSLIQTFTIETVRYYTDKDNVSHEVKDFLTFETKNKSLVALSERSIGDKVRVSFTLGGKKWKDSYFNKLTCTSLSLIEAVKREAGYQAPQAPKMAVNEPNSNAFVPNEDDLPF